MEMSETAYNANCNYHTIEQGKCSVEKSAPHTPREAPSLALGTGASARDEMGEVHHEVCLMFTFSQNTA